MNARVLIVDDDAFMQACIHHDYGRFSTAKTVADLATKCPIWPTRRLHGTGSAVYIKGRIVEATRTNQE